MSAEEGSKFWDEEKEKDLVTDPRFEAAIELRKQGQYDDSIEFFSEMLKTFEGEEPPVFTAALYFQYGSTLVCSIEADEGSQDHNSEQDQKEGTAGKEIENNADKGIAADDTTGKRTIEAEIADNGESSSKKARTAAATGESSSSSSSSSADSGDAHGDTHGELGELVRGVTVSDMGHKTVANDLDNARVWFDHVQLPHDALLNKFAFVDPADGTYHTREGQPAMRIEVIGQRLLTGRQAIAEAALLSSKCLHLKTEEYAKQKKCNGLAGEVSLSSLPHIANVFADSYKELDRMLSFAASVERRLNAVLVSDGAIPDADLVDAIAVLKVKSVEVSVARSHALRLEVGSYALMHGTGFELADMLLTCKFAEGDSRILLLKLARDRLKRVGKDGLAKTALLALGLAGKVGEGAEARAALALALKLSPVKGKGAAAQAKALDENWRDVYALADLVCERHLAQQQQEQLEAGGGQKAEFVEGSCVERLKPSNVAFDVHWQQKQMSGYVISEMKAAGDW